MFSMHVTYDMHVTCMFLSTCMKVACNMQEISTREGLQLRFTDRGKSAQIWYTCPILGIIFCSCNCFGLCPILGSVLTLAHFCQLHPSNMDIIY